MSLIISPLPYACILYYIRWYGSVQGPFALLCAFVESPQQGEHASWCLHAFTWKG